MPDGLHLSASIAIVGVCLAAAFTDARTGRIPNFLTLPALSIGLLVNALSRGLAGAAGSIAGTAACALVPLTLYRASGGRAIGGGDVKLFAAIGALGGAALGVEIEFLSFIALGLFAMLWLTFRGALGRVLSNTFWFALNPVLPERLRRPVCPEQMTEMRLGPAIFVSATAAVLWQRVWG